MVKRLMMATRHSSSSRTTTASTTASCRMRTRDMTVDCVTPSQRPAQVLVEQALVDQLVPVERLLELADGHETVDDCGKPILGEIAAAPVLPLVVFRQDGVGLGETHLPDLRVDARTLLAIAVDELDRLAM